MIGFGIDVGTSSLKFSQISQENGQIQIMKLFSFDLPKTIENFSIQTAHQLKEFLAEKKIIIRNALVGISGKEINVRYIKVMTAASDRIEQIVQMELAQISEKVGIPLVHSYMPLDFFKGQPGGIVVMAIAHNPWLMELQNFFKAAGVKILGFVPNSFALYQAYCQIGKICDKELVYLVSLEHSHSDIAIAYESNLIFLRNLNIGISSPNQIILDDDEISERIETISAEEANLANKTTTIPSPIINDPHKISDALEASLKFARLQTSLKDRKIQKILLAGNSSTQKELELILIQQFKCTTSRLEFSPEITILNDADPQQYWSKQPELFTNALGLAFLSIARPKSKLLLLTQHQQQQENIWGKKIWEYSAIGITLILMFISLANIFYFQQHYKTIAQHTEERYQTLSDRAKKIQELEQETQQIQNKVVLLQSQISMNKYILDTLTWFQKNIPEQIYLTKISFKPPEEERIILIRGIVEESNNDVYTALKDFKQSFQSIFQIVQEKDPKIYEEGRLEFEIHLKMINCQEN